MGQVVLNNTGNRRGNANPGQSGRKAGVTGPTGSVESDRTATAAFKNESKCATRTDPCTQNYCATEYAERILHSFSVSPLARQEVSLAARYL